MRPILAAALSLFLVAPALADDSARLTGAPAALLAGAAAEGTQHELPSPPVTAITAGSTPIVLDKTTLADVAAAFGGSIQTASDSAQSVSWVCYAQPADGGVTEFWFVSDGAMGGAGHAVTLVVSDLAPGAKPNCGAPGGGLTAIDFSVPGLGDSEQAVRTKFGALSPLSGLVAYLNQSKSGLQSLNYRIEDGRVTGVAVSSVKPN